MMVSAPGSPLKVTVNVSEVTTASNTVTLLVPLSTICTKGLSVAATAPVTVMASAAAPPVVVYWAANLMTAAGAMPAAKLDKATDAGSNVNTPAFEMVAAPLKGTPVATLLLFPTKILPLDKVVDKPALPVKATNAFVLAFLV